MVNMQNDKIDDVIIVKGDTFSRTGDSSRENILIPQNIINK